MREAECLSGRGISCTRWGDGIDRIHKKGREHARGNLSEPETWKKCLAAVDGKAELRKLRGLHSSAKNGFLSVAGRATTWLDRRGDLVAAHRRDGASHARFGDFAVPGSFAARLQADPDLSLRSNV